MNILQRIDLLRKERDWTIYRLADEAGITQSTLANMYARHTLPSITTLTSICNALGITLSQFFNETETTESLTNSEKTLLINYRQLSSRNKSAVQNLIINLK